MNDFWSGLGFAFVLLVLLGPLSYCAAHGPRSPHERMVIACIEARGEWNGDKCTFPEEKK
jgi:hypothetical protein